jgi:hypothetical protein
MGVLGRGHKNNIFTAGFNVLGIAFGFHKKYYFKIKIIILFIFPESIIKVLIKKIYFHFNSLKADLNNIEAFYQKYFLM